MARTPPVGGWRCPGCGRRVVLPVYCDRCVPWVVMGGGGSLMSGPIYPVKYSQVSTHVLIIRAVCTSCGGEMQPTVGRDEFRRKMLGSSDWKSHRCDGCGVEKVLDYRYPILAVDEYDEGRDKELRHVIQEGLDDKG